MFTTSFPNVSPDKERFEFDKPRELGFFLISCSSERHQEMGLVLNVSFPFGKNRCNEGCKNLPKAAHVAPSVEWGKRLFVDSSKFSERIQRTAVYQSLRNALFTAVRLKSESKKGNIQQYDFRVR